MANEEIQRDLKKYAELQERAERAAATRLRWRRAFEVIRDCRRLHMPTRLTILSVEFAKDTRVKCKLDGLMATVNFSFSLENGRPDTVVRTLVRMNLLPTWMAERCHDQVVKIISLVKEDPGRNLIGRQFSIYTPITPAADFLLESLLINSVPPAFLLDPTAPRRPVLPPPTPVDSEIGDEPNFTPPTPIRPNKVAVATVPQRLLIGGQQFFSNNPFIEDLMPKNPIENCVVAVDTVTLTTGDVQTAPQVLKSSSEEVEISTGANSTLSDAADQAKLMVLSPERFRLNNNDSTSNLNGFVVDQAKLNLAPQQIFTEPKRSTSELPTQQLLAPLNTVSPPSSSDVTTSSNSFPWSQAEFKFLPVTPEAKVSKWRRRFSNKKKVPVVIVVEKRSLKTIFKRQISVVICKST